MIKIYTNRNITTVSVMKAALESREIECRLKNENLTGALGELPFTETWPEIWIVDEQKEELAKSIIENIISGPPESEKSWTCGSCKEIIEGQFSECWNCGFIKGSDLTEQV